MSATLFNLPKLIGAYKNWVNKNPQVTSDCETTVKWLSYFLVGRVNNSQVFTELIYSLSNLLVLINDRIINSARQLEPPSSGDTIKLWLTIVNYSEVFFELSAHRLAGNPGKWLIIVCIQVFKCLSRLLLLFHHRESIIETPPIPLLERNALQKTDDCCNPPTKSNFTLKSSGRVVRSVEAAPPLHLRNWKAAKVDKTFENEATQSVSRSHLTAETIYVLKPLTQLGLTAYFGENSWPPWIGSLFMDMATLRLYDFLLCSKPRQVQNNRVRMQLSRRTVALIMYILRSPFYEKYTEGRLKNCLNSIGRNIPLARIISDPLLQYLPFWQRNYSYMWST